MQQLVGKWLSFQFYFESKFLSSIYFIFNDISSLYVSLILLLYNWDGKTRRTIKHLTDALSPVQPNTLISFCANLCIKPEVWHSITSCPCDILSSEQEMRINLPQWGYKTYHSRDSNPHPICTKLKRLFWLESGYKNVTSFTVTSFNKAQNVSFGICFKIVFYVCAVKQVVSSHWSRHNSEICKSVKGFTTLLTRCYKIIAVLS